MMLNFVFCYKSHKNNTSKKKYKSLSFECLHFSLFISRIMAVMNLPTLAIFLYAPGFESQ